MKDTIFYGFHGADLVTGVDTECAEIYDTRKSASRYAEQVKVKLEQMYPGAEVEVDYDLDAGGSLPQTLQPSYNGETDAREIGFIDQAANQVYSDFQWMVPSERAMEAAHYTTSLSRDANYLDLDGDAKATAWAHEMGLDEDEATERYNAGVATLDIFTLGYSARFVRGTTEPTMSAKTVDYIKVNAGHIASSEAQRLAVFLIRSTD